MKLSNDLLNIDLSCTCLQNLIHFMFRFEQLVDIILYRPTRVRFQTKHLYQVSYKNLNTKNIGWGMQYEQIKPVVLLLLHTLNRMPLALLFCPKSVQYLIFCLYFKLCLAYLDFNMTYQHCLKKLRWEEKKKIFFS